jgi:cysteine desulfurase/selenocysteine lyase
MNRKDFLLKTALSSFGLTGIFRMAEGRVSELNQSDASDFCLEKGVVYLNNGTMGPSPKVVEEEVIKIIKRRNARGTYGGGEPTLKKKLAAFLGVEKEEIALTQNVTHGINSAIHGLELNKDDEVLITTHEHVGNAAPWLNRQQEIGFKIVPISESKSADQALESIINSTTSKTRVIAIPHITCTIGQVYPIKEICAFAKSKGILTLIDGAHGPGMMDLDLKDIGCDIYASCMHKWMLGPAGLGFLYVNKALLPDLKPAFAGHYGLKSWSTEQGKQHFDRQYTDASYFQYGTHNAALYYGGSAAIDFLQEEGMDFHQKRIDELNQYLLESVQEYADKLKILTPTEKVSRSGILAFKMNNDRDKEFQTYARSQGVILRFVGESDLNCIRVSTHIYNSRKDIDKMMKLLTPFL